MVGEIEITADNRSVINPTAEELSMGPLLREAHSSVAHKKLPKRRSDAIGAIGGHCCLAVVISPRAEEATEVHGLLQAEGSCCSCSTTSTSNCHLQ